MTELSQRYGWVTHKLQPNADLDGLLTEFQPGALAWDLAEADLEDWALIQRLRSHPQFSNLPFILYNQDDSHPDHSTGMIDVIMKPVHGKTLVEVLETLRPNDISGPVLIVDDDAQARAFYRRLVTDALPGCTLIEAENGAVALAILDEETPCLVILDLMMPEVDGFTVLERLRLNPRTRLVPVLVLSGKILSLEDVRRLDYAQVIFHSKELLSTDEAIASLQRVVSGRGTLSQPTSILVKYALAYLHQNYTNPLTRQEIADAVGVSKNYLSEIFRQEVGISPWDCLTRFRLQKAKELLRNTGDSITSIATRTGFDDPAYFSRVFRSHFGVTPQKYRQGDG